MLVLVLTTLGNVVYESHAIVQSAAVNYWKLKAIDSLEMSNEFSKEQQQKIVSLLLDNQELKDSLPK